MPGRAHASQVSLGTISHAGNSSIYKQQTSLALNLVTFVTMSLHAPEHVGLVTGAGSGIARVIAHQLCADGITKIALIDINKAAVEQTAKMIETRYPSAKTMVFVADISQENGADAAIAAAVKEFGRLDCCVNAAGVQGPFRPTGEQATPDMDKIVNVDLRGLWFCERAELREFMKQDMRPLTCVYNPLFFASALCFVSY